ncbi:hypothetical protein, partial [Escherichia coli]
MKLEYDGNNYQNDFAGKLKKKKYSNVGVVIMIKHIIIIHLPA